MGFLKEMLAKETSVTNRETTYAKLVTLTPTSPVIVNGEPKERLLAEISIDGKVIAKSVFTEAVAGRPTFVPEGGLDCQATFKQVQGEDANGIKVTYLNLIALGVKAA